MTPLSGKEDVSESEANSDTESFNDGSSQSAELTDFPLFSLSKELQVEIFRNADQGTLSSLSRTCKHVAAMTVPLLWRFVDFVDLKEQGITANELIHAQADFFGTCSRIMDEDPGRWRELASYVRTLRLVKLPSIGVIKEEEGEREENTTYDCIYRWNPYSDDQTIFDIIACFEHLMELQFYIKSYFDHNPMVAAARKIKDKLMKLKVVEIGGEVPEEMMLAILSKPEIVERLTCMALLDGTVSQTSHSGGTIFLSEIAPRFVALKSLHLCKLAELSEDQSVSRLRWSWDRDNDLAVLADWASLLEAVSPTLVELTLEDCYMLNCTPTEISVHDSVEADETRNGSISSQRFRGVILPVLAELSWPQLERLVFKGLHIGPGTLQNAGVTEKLGANVEVEFMSGWTMQFTDDVTPINMSPPPGDFHDEH